MTSIRRHLTILLVSGFAILLAVCGSAIYEITRFELQNEFDGALKAKALTVMTQTEQNTAGIQVEQSPALKQEFEDSSAPQHYELWRTDGDVFARSGSLAGADLPCRFGSESRPVFWNLSLPMGVAGRAIGFTFRPKFEDEDERKHAPKEAILVVAADRRALDRTTNILAAVLAATGFLALALTVPLVRIAVRRGHAPLAALARQAGNITSESLEDRFPSDALPEELLPITGRLNDLLGRLEGSFARERQFSADLAHELRTPVAELRAQAEVGLQFPDGQSVETHQETLKIALQMQSIVSRLIDLARCENRQITLQHEVVNLAALVTELWRPFAALAAEKGLTVRVDIPVTAELQTDPPMFRSILGNLLSNAVTYAPPHGIVTISWHAQPAHLIVSNTVFDLEPSDLPHMFERLWRKDKSRTDGLHSGLGLALSRACATVLGLTLTASFTNDQTIALILGTSRGRES